MKSAHHHIYVAVCQLCKHAIYTAIRKNHISTIMKQEYLSLCKKRSDHNVRLTKLWTEVKDICAQLSFHLRKRNELANRLNDSNKSLTGPAISCIAGGPYNQSLRNFVLLMTLKRSEIQTEIETEQSIIDNFTNRYNIVLEDHNKLCREANIIDQQIWHISNQISHDTRISWHDIQAADSL